MMLAEQLPTTGWNGRDLSPVMAALGLEVRRLLGIAWEDETTAPVVVRADDVCRVHLPVFFSGITGVMSASGRTLDYTVTATCADTPGFESSPRILEVMGATNGEKLTINGTHGMTTIPVAVVEYAAAYGSILTQRMERMGVKSKSMGNVNVTYTDATGLTPRQEALQVTGSAILAYRLEPLTPSLELSRLGWWSL